MHVNFVYQVIQKRMEELKVQADASSQKHLAMLQELSLNLKAKEDIIQKLQAKLTETEVDQALHQHNSF